MSYFQVVILNVDENPELEWDQANSNRAKPLVKAKRIEGGPMSPFKTAKLDKLEIKATDSLPVTLMHAYALLSQIKSKDEIQQDIKSRIGDHRKPDRIGLMS